MGRLVWAFAVAHTTLLEIPCRGSTVDAEVDMYTRTNIKSAFLLSIYIQFQCDLWENENNNSNETHSILDISSFFLIVAYTDVSASGKPANILFLH